MVAIPVYDPSGSQTRQIDIDPKLLDKAVRKGLLKESLIAFLASQRQGTHATKSRGMVQGGNSKPWKQKGTGRARQGCTRSPQWVGGGRAFGPMPRDYSYRMNKQQRRLAVRSSIRFKIEQGLCCAVEGITGLKEPRTKQVAGFLKGAGLIGRGALIVAEDHDANLYLSARNLDRVDVAKRSDLNAGHILQRERLVFTAQALEALLKEVAA